MTIARRILWALLAAAIMFECAVLALGAVYHSRRAPYFLAPGESLPALLGYGRDLNHGLHMATRQCAIYRFVSLHCPACGQEEPEWELPSVQAATRDCQIFILQIDLQNAPYYIGKTATQQIIWVPLDWAKSVRVTITPTTIVTVSGKIVWVDEGEIDAASLADLKARLRHLGSG